MAEDVSVDPMFRSILLTVDRYRRKPDAWQGAISLAQRLHASLQIVYAVDHRDVRILAPGPPSGEMTMRFLRGSVREKQLVAEGHEQLQTISSACRRESIDHIGGVSVGYSEVIWAEQARCCDLVMIHPAEEDFEFVERWLGTMFWRIARRSCRPVLVFRENDAAPGNVVLFHSKTLASARALPWVAMLCSALGLSVTVYVDGGLGRDYAIGQECQPYLELHQVSADLGDKSAMQVLEGELGEPGSEIASPSVLAFDSGFSKGLPFRKRRRLVDRLMRTSPHSVLLCP